MHWSVRPLIWKFIRIENWNEWLAKRHRVVWISPPIPHVFFSCCTLSPSRICCFLPAPEKRGVKFIFNLILMNTIYEPAAGIFSLSLLLADLLTSHTHYSVHFFSIYTLFPLWKRDDASWLNPRSQLETPSGALQVTRRTRRQSLNGFFVTLCAPSASLSLEHSLHSHPKGLESNLSPGLWVSRAGNDAKSILLFALFAFRLAFIPNKSSNVNKVAERTLL